MYPLLRTATIIWRARSRKPLAIDEESEISLRAGLFDIDIFGELNNARHLNMMELGRWDFSQRVGFIAVMKKNRWAAVIGGASLRYRRRIRFLARYTLHTRLLCHDGRWFYFLQETHRNGRICSSGLIKAGVSNSDGLVPAPEVAAALNYPDWNPPVPPWVQAWIDAEGQRPWPSS